MRRQISVRGLQWKHSGEKEEVAVCTASALDAERLRRCWKLDAKLCQSLLGSDRTRVYRRLRFFSFGPVFIDLAPAVSVDSSAFLFFHGVPLEAAPLQMVSVLRNLQRFLHRPVCKSLVLAAF